MLILRIENSSIISAPLHCQTCHSPISFSGLLDCFIQKPVFQPFSFSPAIQSSSLLLYVCSSSIHFSLDLLDVILRLQRVFVVVVNKQLVYASQFLIINSIHLLYTLAHLLGDICIQFNVLSLKLL